MSDPDPGPWLRACALVAAAGTLLAVISGAVGLGGAHRIVAALSAPPIVALVIAARLQHRRLLPPTAAAAVLVAAATVTSTAARATRDGRRPGATTSCW